MKPIQETTDTRLAAKQRWAEGSTADERRRVVCRLRQERQLWRILLLAIALLVALAFLAAVVVTIAVAFWPLVLIGLAIYALLKTKRIYSHQTPDTAMREYKRVLAGILPAGFLTADGLLCGRDGKPEPICIETARGLGFGGFKVAMTRLPRWLFYAKLSSWPYAGAYSGPLHLKAIRHRLEKHREILPSDEYAALQGHIDEALSQHDTKDFIDIRHAVDTGTLAHETFHDIQGFLYDNHPDIIDALQQAIDNNKDVIRAWYDDDGDRLCGYRFHQIFPSTVEDVPYPSSTLASWIRWLDAQVNGEAISEAAWDAVLIEGFKDGGRLEAIPTLLGAAIEGDRGAKAILGDVFVSAGLKDELVRAGPAPVTAEEFLTHLTLSPPNNDSCGSAK